MRKPPADPERTKRLRTAGAAMLGFALFTVLSALAFSYGSMGGALNSGVFGAFIALLALAILRNPFASGPVCFLSGLAGVWLVLSPFVFDFFPYLITTALTLWTGLLTLLLSAFIYGEANDLEQRLEATD